VGGCNQLYLVMDYVNGGELFYHLERRGPFNEAAVRLYAAELTLALDSLHQRGIVYRCGGIDGARASGATT
jgi:serine/threonine protein kinase